MLQRVQRQLQMTVMNRIEAASEQSDRRRCSVHSLRPFARTQEVRIQSCFRRAGLWLPVVFPMHDRRQRHQNRFGAASRLQAEQCAAIEYEVEFDVAPTPVRLKIALALAVGHVAPPLDDRHVGIEKRIADRALHRKALRETGLVEIIEEHAANAARLVAMLQIKVFVAPLLEARVFVGAEGL